MKVAIVLPLELEMTDVTLEGSDIVVGLHVRLDGGFRWEAFGANVTIERLNFLMESLVVRQHPLCLEGFRTLRAFEWTIGRVSHSVAGQVLLGLEPFSALLARKVELDAVGELVPQHVRLLHECMLTDGALVRLFSAVDVHVAVQRERLGEGLVTDIADVAF